MTNRVWLPALAIGVIAAAAVGLTYLTAMSGFGLALGLSWIDANVRSQLTTDAVNVASQLKSQHRSQAQIARAVVDAVRSAHGYDAVVVSDGGKVLAGNADLASGALPPPMFVRNFDVRLSAPPPGAPGGASPQPDEARPAPGAPQSNIVFRIMPPGAGPPLGGFRAPWSSQLFAMRRAGQDGFDVWHVPVSVVRIDGAYVVVSRSPDLLADMVSRVRWLAVIVGVAAFGLTLLVTQRALRTTARPVELVRSSLARLGRGDYSRLSAADPDDGVTREFVDAYNAAAEALAASAAARQETEANARRFVADAGHELRTPLAVITGYIDLLRQSSSGDNVMERRIFTEIQGQSERMRALIADMLFLMRLDSQEPADIKIIDASDIVRSVVDSFRTLADGTALQVDAQSGAFVQISENELRQAVGNLIDNALKYAPGSTVTASVRAEGGQVVLTVADGGPGMSPEVRARAFERFARGETSGSIPGSGLGLAIVARTTERAGGSVSLHTEPGKGVAVEMRLPAWRASA